MDERCEQGQGRPGRRRCGERAGNGESSRSERSTRPRWPCCSRSAAAAAATALIRGGARQALAAAECRASSFSWRSGHGWLVPLDARGVRPRARMRAYQGRRRRGRRQPTTTVTNVHEGALVLDVLVLDRRFIQRPLRLHRLPLRSKRESKSVFCCLQEQEVGKAAAFCPCKPNGKKMRSLFNAQKKRRKKNESEKNERAQSRRKKGGGKGEKTKTLSLPFSRFELLCVSGPCPAPALPVRHLWLGASPLVLLLHLHLQLLGEGEEEAKTSDQRRRGLRQCPLPPPPPPRQPPAIPIRSAQRKPPVPRLWSQTR